MITLSSDQIDALNVIQGSEHRAIFLTGKAGTGKSTVLGKIQGRKVFTALTGLAASLIGGRTLHSFLSMGPNSKKANYYKAAERLKGVQFLIIDEVSMMNTELLNQVFVTLQKCRYSGKLILVGDFKQLPPVQGEPCYKSQYWDMVKEVHLTTCHRQDDDTFISVLNDIREGHSSQALRNFLSERIVEEPPRDYTAIYPHDKKAKSLNNERLGELETEPYLFDMSISDIKFKLFEDEEEYMDLVEKQTNFSSDLVLKVGARVMTIVNHPDGMYVNGSTGVITRIGPTVIDVQLDDGYNVPITLCTLDYTNGADQKMFEYTQYPLMLAWATTIHKSQGQSLSRLYVDTRAHFAKGMTYVALSRATDPDHLKVSAVL